MKAEDVIQELVQWLRLGVETLGALIVGLGVILSAFLFLQALARREAADGKEQHFGGGSKSGLHPSSDRLNTPYGPPLPYPLDIAGCHSLQDRRT